IALAAFFLSGIVVVDSIQVGLDLVARFPDQRLHFVTVRGERVVGPGIVYGGTGGTRAGSVLRREDELGALGEEIGRSAAALAETVAGSEALRSERMGSQAEQEQAARDLRDSEHAHRALEARRAEQTIRGDAMGQAAGAVRTALDSLEVEIGRTVGEAERAEVALQSADQERGRVDEILAREESEFRALEQEREHLTALHAEARIEATRSRTEHESAQREIERMGLAADEAERDIRSRTEEASETERRIQETAALCVQREEELSQEIAHKADKELALSKTRERFGEVKGKADDIEARTRDLRREHNELIERLHRIELEQAETDGELRRLAERVWNEYEIELAAYVPADATDASGAALVELEEGDLADADEGQVPDEAIVDRAVAAGEPAAPTVPLGADASPEERRDRLRTLQE